MKGGVKVKGHSVPVRLASSVRQHHHGVPPKLLSMQAHSTKALTLPQDLKLRTAKRARGPETAQVPPTHATPTVTSCIHHRLLLYLAASPFILIAITTCWNLPLTFKTPAYLSTPESCDWHSVLRFPAASPLLVSSLSGVASLMSASDSAALCYTKSLTPFLLSCSPGFTQKTCAP